MGISTRVLVEVTIDERGAHRLSRRHMIRTTTLALLSLATACTTDGVLGEETVALTSQGVDAYQVAQPVNDADFTDVTSQIPALGGTVLAGHPTIKIRFDAPPDGVTAHGVFEELGAAKIRIHFPFDEHMQVIDGRLRITDAAGTQFVLGVGDAYFIAQGTTVTWEVLTPRFQKSFFDYTHPAP
jgi:uncharacterized cupin superfamily protein